MSSHPHSSLGLEMLQTILGDPVTDPEEESFLIFSQAIPSQSLGFVDSKAPTIQVSVAGRDLEIRQSRGLLTSDRSGGTTGAVVWKVTPLFAEWIASPNFLFDAGYLDSASTALELGAGVSGIVALTLSSKIKRYIATDQDYVIKILKQNILDNLPVAPSDSKGSQKRARPRTKTPQAKQQTSSPRVDTLELDWEMDSMSSLPHLLGEQDNRLDLVIACDCIYNEALIEPFNSTCAQLCRLGSDMNPDKPTLCVVAQQLRSPDVFESWATNFHSLFHVWRVPDKLLTPPLREDTGFVVHIGLLR
ncbi:hypothetical protein BU24DRAFT_118785 [Aaosphaeria arxii CBS 175.79]|uniref:Diaminohydroxyphosphoribosylamino-pyrimidine deaminase n=1 Tax=Aaosphaeria arxii CBS 175.79 TaxID=1450172 RepID=A0A6A5Y2B0_9PLEO|nr:uncharacterized protein BU24DRAFT_118785 [Aaosphaeria arxii CBS 175.79]KAF2019379.1 hypothetical protein BU24DRAFT_118785 [Aaosphaeria arxii CBS 175.79]